MENISDYLPHDYLENIDSFSLPVRQRQIVSARDQFISSVLAQYQAHNGEGLYAHFPTLYIHWSNHIVQFYTLMLAQQNDEIKLPDMPPYLKELKAGPPVPSKLRMPLRVIRNMIIRDGISRPIPSRHFDFKNKIVVNAIGSLIQHHAQSINDRVHYIPNAFWFSPIVSHPPLQCAEADLLWSYVLESFGEDKSLIEQHIPIQAWFKKLFTDSLFYCDLHKKRLFADKGVIPHHLWIGSGSNIWSRILKNVVHHSGGMVTGHDHGSGVGHLISKSRTLAECNDCDVFVTFSTSQDSFSQILDPRFIFMPPPRVKPLNKTATRDDNDAVFPTQKRAGRKVLVMPSAPSKGIPRFLANSDAADADFLYRFLRELSVLGYEVYVKPHPHCPRLIKDAALEKLGVCILCGTIKEAFDIADIVVFQHIHTTTFREALEAGKHITILDMQYDPWTTTAQSLIGERCSLLDVSYDQNNRIQIDWASVSMRLEEARDKNDPQFYNFYYN